MISLGVLEGCYKRFLSLQYRFFNNQSGKFSMSQFDQVSVVKKANVYFDGKCVSHSVLMPDGTRKSVGVIMPNVVLTFNTGTPEIMEIIDGSCRANIAQSEWKTYRAGEQFNVAANTRFDIEALDNAPVHYVCHFG